MREGGGLRLPGLAAVVGEALQGFLHAAREHPEPAVIQLHDAVLVEATVLENNAAAIPPVTAFVVGDEDIRAAHGVQLVVAIGKGRVDVPAFPQRHG